MALALEVATLARAWTRQIFARKPPSGDGSYDGFNLKQVPAASAVGSQVIERRPAVTGEDLGQAFVVEPLDVGDGDFDFSRESGVGSNVADVGC
jgi:hypothetical protein